MWRPWITQALLVGIVKFQPLWKTGWQLLKVTKYIYIFTYYMTQQFAFLDIYQREMKDYVHTKTCM